MLQIFLQLLKQHGRTLISAAFAVLCVDKKRGKNHTQDVLTRCFQQIVKHLAILLVADRQYSKVFFGIALLFSINALAVTPPGTIISNTATSNYTLTIGANNFNYTTDSNISSFTSTIIGTSALIEQFAYIAGTSTLNEETVTQCFNNTVLPGSFITPADPVNIDAGTGTSAPFDPAVPQALIPANDIHAGDAVVIRVRDADQNLDATTAEVIEVTVTSSLGDQETIQLTEVDANSEFFIGYLQTTSNAVDTFNCELSVDSAGTFTANYIDQFDATDTADFTTLVDPFGILFDSVTGAAIDGATVTLFEDTGGGTLIPAAVFGDDGVSTYPNVLISGSTAADSSGTVYNFPVGGYRFPLVAPGNYRLVVTPPAGFTSPSSVSITDLQALPGAPFALLANGSFEQTFTVNPGPPVHIDIPLDPLASTLIVEKTAAIDSAAIGDFIQYRVNIENVDLIAVAANVVLNDRLPVGFRYQAGSAYVDNVQIADPIIAANGRDLQFAIGDLAVNGGDADLRYVVEIAAGTQLGRAVNTAFAEDAGGTTSNTSQHAIEVKDDLLRTNGILVGRVIAGNCPELPAAEGAEKEYAEPGTGAGLPGVAGVKIYLEDGTFVITDKDGKYHVEGLVPGTHVVQVDLDSLPSNMEIMSCVNNTRFADTPYSQFVDMAGGSLWRADFYVKEKPPIEDTVELSIRSEIINDKARIYVENNGGSIDISNYRLTVMLPDGMHYVAGSSHIDEKNVADPQVFDTVVIYRMGDVGKNWQKSIYFDTDISINEIKSLLSVKALATFNSKDKKNIRSKPINTSIDVIGAKKSRKEYTFKPKFPSLSTDLINVDKRNLDKIVRVLEGLDVKSITVIGHTDNQRISKRNQHLYKDNYALSQARAQSVVDYLSEKLPTQNVKFKAEGVGPDQPVATNKTEAGRSKNRRVDIIIDTYEVVKKAEYEAKAGEKTTKTVAVKRVVERNELPVVKTAKKLHIEAFDKIWLEKQNDSVEWLMPSEGFIPKTPAINIAIKHAANHTIEAKLNGEELNPLFFFGRIQNTQATVARSYWQGIHLQTGPNAFNFTIRDENYKVVEVIEKDVHYSGAPVRIELVEEYSRLVADGVNNPVIAVRFYDRWNKPLRAGASGEFKISDPYISSEFYESLRDRELSGLDRENPIYEIGSDGIALIELVATTETGVAELTFDFPNQIQRTLKAWLTPKLRDWIMVGVVDAQVSIDDISGNEQSATDNDFEDDTLTDGKVSFFAKGRVKGDWLLTAAYNSDKETNSDTEERLFSVIDPDEYYTLYGDDTRQGYESASTDKLYIKIERDKFYALYGDYNTDLDETELSKYNRSLTGLKSEFENNRFLFNIFAAETNNRFIREEIPGNGTSGLYQLSRANEGSGLVLNSERITIETRDRFRSEIIIESRELRRHLDYNIDYDNGTLFFKEPIANRDFNFNPVFIVAEYEVNNPVDGEITAGGRGAVKFADDKVELGVTVIDDGTFAQEGQLYGVDATFKVTPSSEINFEYASSEQDSANTAPRREGDAYLLEYEISDADKDARIYLRENEGGFGLGQLNGSENGTRKKGIEGAFSLSNSLRINAEYFNEENLNRNPVRERDVLSAGLAYVKPSYGASVGFTFAEDSDENGSNEQKSELIDIGLYKKFFDGRLLARIDTAQTLSSNNDNSDFNKRTIIGADFDLYKNIELLAEYEITDTDADNTDTESARIGLRSSPWQRAEVRTTFEQQESEDGLRVFANLGLTQAFVINERWSADAIYEKSETVSDNTRSTFNTNVPPASGSTSSAGDFDALSLGSTYRLESQEFVGRVESRNSNLDEKLAVILGWKREHNDGLGLSARLQSFITDFDSGAEEKNSELRLSLSYRPIDSRWIHLNRLDYVVEDNRDASGINSEADKIVNNWKSNFIINSENQLAFSYGYKDVVTNIDQDQFDGVTHFLAGEYRFDISPTLDLGLQTSFLQSTNAGLSEDSYGISVGWTFARNTWLSVGYNFEGFNDDDFADADYSVSGLYAKLRFKFDQDTFKLNKK